MSEALAITHVKVFDGNALTEERTVVIDHGVISAAPTADRTVDGQHGTLLPGFIDCHVHLASLAQLEQGTQWGCTTMLDMGSQLACQCFSSGSHCWANGLWPSTMSAMSTCCI